MKAAEVLRELEAFGSEQTRKTWARHGIQGPMFGVNYSALGKLKKRLRTDHELALALWESGNHDARVLATMIADPSRMSRADLEAWLGDVNYHALAHAVAGVAAASPDARDCARSWIAARNEWQATCGYSLLARLAQEPGAFTAAELRSHLAGIERGIHGAKNRVREAMNQAVIGIGCNPELTEDAIAAARRIGKVEVDQGDTECKTPDAEAYIRKTVAHRAAKAARGTAAKAAPAPKARVAKASAKAAAAKAGARSKKVVTRRR